MTGGNGSHNGTHEGRRWQFGWCEFTELSRRLLVHGQPAPLEPKPADVLVLLLERPNEPHTKDALLGGGWPESKDGAGDPSLTTAIRKLRAAFGGGRDEIILTIPNVGYRMAVPVVERLAAEPEAPTFRIEAGDPIPRRPHWRAQRPLDAAQTVWLAEHAKTHEARVFKFAVDGVRLRALQREVTLSRLLRKSLPDTPGFVRVMDWDLEELPYFIESEFAGANLLEFAASEPFRDLPLAGRVALAAEIVETVAAAHSLGILHNDLKPSNVLILEDLDGAPGKLGVKVADFGVASLTQPERLRQMEITEHGFAEGAASAGTPVGTGMYRAPEIFAGGPAGTLVDVYALGVMLYQIACGDFIEPLSPGWESRIPDPLLREDIAAAAHIDPAQRIATAAELAARLRTIETRRAEQAAREAELAKQEHDRRALERERLRRPWVAFAMLALVAGLGASLWFARSAQHARVVEEQSNQTLAQMNQFLAEDLLEQSNPLAPGTGSTSQITLIDAIYRALPKIGPRFAQAPGVAARLHLTIGAALDARTDFSGAAAQFDQAARLFLEADGSLSQDAMIARLRRDNSLMRTAQDASIKAAKADFQVRQREISRLPHVSAELDAWQALIQSGSQLYSANPKQALGSLNEAIRRAQAAHDVSPRLLMALEARVAGIYLRLADGASAEHATRRAIAAITAADGPESHELLQSQMFLQEAFFLQGKYREAMKQGDENYARFSRILGPQNQLTMAALTMRAETEGAMEDYANAIRDELTLNKVERSLPSGAYLTESTLSDVALMECHSNQIRSGIAHAQEVIAESGKGPAAQPVFSSAATLTLAECLITEQENTKHARGVKAPVEANRLLNSLDVAAMKQYPGYAHVEGNIDTAKARAALIEGHYEVAKSWVDKAGPFLAEQDADAYERRAASRVRTALATHKN